MINGFNRRDGLIGKKLINMPLKVLDDTKNN
jgi:hypothetical protein